MDDYIIANGKKIPKSEFYRTLSVNQIKRFAYDPQLSLFPVSKIEEARKSLKAKFDNGKIPKIKIISSLF